MHRTLQRPQKLPRSGRPPSRPLLGGVEGWRAARSVRLVHRSSRGKGEMGQFPARRFVSGEGSHLGRRPSSKEGHWTAHPLPERIAGKGAGPGGLSGQRCGLSLQLWPGVRKTAKPPPRRLPPPAASALGHLPSRPWAAAASGLWLIGIPSPHGRRARAGAWLLWLRQINSREERRFCKHAKY